MQNANSYEFGCFVGLLTSIYIKIDVNTQHIHPLIVMINLVFNSFFSRKYNLVASEILIKINQEEERTKNKLEQLMEKVHFSLKWSHASYIYWLHL